MIAYHDAMPAALTFVIYALAVARLSVLVTDDRITEAPRRALLRRAKEGGYLEYLAVCQWCVSVWIGAIAAFVWWNWPDAWWSLGPAAALAFSFVAGKLSQIGG